MLLTTALLVLLCTVNCLGEHTARCGTESEVGTTIRKTDDGVEGRYTVEWCTRLPDIATFWEFRLSYIHNSNESKKCPDASNVVSSISMSNSLDLHSKFDERLIRPLVCNITCLSKNLDLVFSGCYVLRNRPFRPGTAGNRYRYWQSNTAIARVDNRFGSAKAFNDIRPFYQIEKSGDSLIVQWDLHYIPLSNYSVTVSDYEKNKTDERDLKWLPIEENCTKSETYSVVCRVRFPPPRHCVAAALRSAAPWNSGSLFRDFNILHYCAATPKEVSLDPGVDRRVWWAVGALALALAALGAGWLAHSALLASLRKRVLQHWTHRYASYTSGPEAGAKAEETGPILLLYARDCAPAMEAVNVFKEMLLAQAPAQVYDIFSPECQSLYAASPSSWLQSVLQRPDVRVVLLQTPAAAALYAQADDTTHMAEPLLGSRVQYRRPHCGDALLQFALRLVRDTAYMQREYTKYYVATFSELESELVPQVAPYRRYELPSHAALLLRDLKLPPLPPGGALPARLGAAAHALLEHVRRHQDYLRDELMFLNPAART